MSTITTLSVFYYGHTVTPNNRYIDFDEGGSELTATLNIGSYSAAEYAVEVQRAMNLVAAANITVSLNRTTRKITIASDGVTLTLRTLTGSHFGTSAYTMIGFTVVANHTGATSYLAENGTGSEYRPQFLLDDYTAIEDFVVKEFGVKQKSVGGRVQTLNYGDGNRATMNIKLITDKDLGQTIFYYNAAGVQAARDFLANLITGAKVEFMPDVSTRATFHTLLLDSTPADKDGLEYRLYNMAKAKDIYETKSLLFRKAQL